MKHIITIIVFSLILGSCQREPVEIIEAEPPIINPTTTPVEASLMGVVVTDTDIPVNGAIVSMYGRETSTGVDGKFLFENATMYSDGTYLTVNMPDYHEASRKFYALEGEINVVKLELIPKEIDDSFQSSTGKIISAENIEIEFPAGEYSLVNDNLYSGNIDVDLINIPFGSSHSFIKMPGDLTGNDLNFDLMAISNFGIFKISLETPNGEEILFPNEVKADFEYKLQDMAISEADLSLWFFDQNNGTWLERGEVSIVNGNYVGEVDNAGYWMMGLAYDYADVGGSLIDSGSTFNNSRIEIHNVNQGYLTSIHSTMNGKFSSRVPQALNLDLSIFHDCTIERQNENLGILDGPTEFEPIQVEMVADNIVVQGTIENCQGLSTSRPYLKIDFGDEQYMFRSDDQGMFDFSFSDCTVEEVSVLAIDDVESTTSGALVFPISNEINVGDIQTCDEIESGYELNYINMDWGSNLESSVTHEWTVSTVSAVEEKVIFSAKMYDELTEQLFLTAAFVFVEGETVADYQLNFKSQGFLISGECMLNEIEYDGLSSFRFEGSNQNVVPTGEGVYPGDVGTVNFNLVYYD